MPVNYDHVTLNPVGPAHDAFGRLRTSNTGQRLDVEFSYNKQPDFFDEVTNNGTVTFNADSRDLTLSLSDSNDGSYAQMSSHPIPYTPGNSQLIDITGVLNLAGISGGYVECFLRSSVTGSITTVTVDESDWESLKDGEPYDNIPIDWSKSQIFSMDFQSLKVGTIRFGLVRNGSFELKTSIHNDNIRNTGYWQLPSLPAFWKIYNSGGITYSEIGYGDDNNAIGFRYVLTANANATMKAICITAKSESGINLKDMTGLSRSISNGQTAKTVSTTLIPLLSIRLKSTFNSLDNLRIALPKSISMTTNNPIRLAIYNNPALTGASWADVDATSAMEYDVTASTLTGGCAIKELYASSPTNNRADSTQGLLGKAVLWNRKSTETGILTIAAIRTGTLDASVLTAIEWEEI